MGNYRIRLVAVDVDGTLLTSRYSISAATREAVRHAVSAGVEVTLASSRSPSGLLPILEELGHAGWTITYQGALICRAIPGAPDPVRVAWELPLAAASARAVLRAARAAALSVGWYCGSRWLTPDIDTAVLRESAITGERPEEVADPSSVAARPHKILCMAADPDGVRRLHMLRDDLPSDCNGVFSHTDYLEVTDHRVDKAAALAHLGGLLGIGLDQMAAVGDGENDRSMLEAVGTPIVMGNAPESLKRLARKVTASNDDDGVAEALSWLRQGNGCAPPSG